MKRWKVSKKFEKIKIICENALFVFANARDTSIFPNDTLQYGGRPRAIVSTQQSTIMYYHDSIASTIFNILAIGNINTLYVKVIGIRKNMKLLIYSALLFIRNE